MSTSDSRFRIFDTHAEAEDAIKALHFSGFNVRKLSLMGKVFRSEEPADGFYTAGNLIKSWGGAAADWGDLCGLSFGPAVFFLPGVGLVALAGPLIARLMSTLESAMPTAGLTPLGAALTLISVPVDQAIQYEAALVANKYFLMVHGGVDDVAKASPILDRCGASKAA